MEEAPRHNSLFYTRMHYLILQNIFAEGCLKACVFHQNLRRQCLEVWYWYCRYQLGAACFCASLSSLGHQGGEQQGKKDVRGESPRLHQFSPPPVSSRSFTVFIWSREGTEDARGKGRSCDHMQPPKKD